MSRTAAAVGLLALAMLVAPGSAHGSLFLFATLTNGGESPPAAPLTTTTGDPRPISFGTALFELNDAMTELRFTATVFNIDFTGMQTADTNDNLVAAHIHAGPTIIPTAPVVWGFFGAPFNDNNPND